jgi:hypothetical protein
MQLVGKFVCTGIQSFYLVAAFTWPLELTRETPKYFVIVPANGTGAK